MKLLVIVCVLLVAPLSSCSKNLSSLCDDSVKNNLLQETYEKNRNPLKMAIANTGFCYNSTNVIGDYCDVKIEVKDVNKIHRYFYQKANPLEPTKKPYEYLLHGMLA